ncbi:MAG: ATP phosphoribosyltransferase regulatory subunit, partial [Alphaproteobacteria bacterium]|nr:ATP phosphoribosyltransferase regulatory subunit [Alphaproteobacteria bacterium]
ESSEFFNELEAGLKSLGIDYELNPRLVRGLDYYCHTAFEFTTTALGAQGAVIAGGRYDGLIDMMGGPKTPGVGWAGGIERLSMLVDAAPAAPRPIVIVPVGATARDAAFLLAETLRRAGYRIDLGYSGNLSKRMKRANKLGACAVILLGDDELARNEATIRHMDSGEQEAAPLETLPEALLRYKQL